jgi:hypothetical protein
MSVLKPKDGDYIGRGILLLLVWTIAGWMPFALVSALLAGAGGAATGFAIGMPLGIFLYSAYLKTDPRVYPRRKQPLN